MVNLQQTLSQEMNRGKQFVLYKGEMEFYLDIDEILFFETDGNQVMAHTCDDANETRKKLYELEGTLGPGFQRISKSSIVNVKKIYAINKNLAASSEISFQNTHKQIYVSRAYYKTLKEKLEEVR